MQADERQGASVREEFTVIFVRKKPQSFLNVQNYKFRRSFRAQGKQKIGFVEKYIPNQPAYISRALSAVFAGRHAVSYDRDRYFAVAVVKDGVLIFDTVFLVPGTGFCVGADFVVD